MEINVKLLQKQKTAYKHLLNDDIDEVLYGGSAGGGKSFFGVLWLTINCLQYPETRWMMGRSVLKILKDTTLKTFFDVCSVYGIKRDEHYVYNGQAGLIKFYNGSEIILKDLYAYPSDPNFDSLGSLEITGAFIDECNQISSKAKQVVKSRIRYKLNEYGLKPKIFMSCNPAKNWVYSEFYQPWKNDALPSNKRFVQALPTDNKHLPESYLDNLRSLEKNLKERLYFGNWEYDDDPSVLMDFEAITDIFTNEHVKDGAGYISADIARFGKDKTVIFVWSGFKVIDTVILDKSSVTESATEINNLSVKYGVPRSKIIVDEDGIGGGVKDILRCKGFINNSKAIVKKSNPMNYGNLKTQCYFELANAVNSSEIFVKSASSDLKDNLIKELEVVKRKDIDKDGKVYIMPKDKVKEILGHSPDYSDALMMRFFFELKASSIMGVA